MEKRRKVALITGSARGLGRMTALLLASEGYDVAVNYVKSRMQAEKLTEELREYGIRAMAVQADITNRDDTIRLAEQVHTDLGPIDILINNAGPFIRERKSFVDYDPLEIEYLVQGNLLSVMLLDRLILPHMQQNGWGRIIHFGFSHAGEARGWPHRAVYAAAKVGLVSFTRTLSEETAEFGVTVNMVCPGDIRGANKERRIQDVDQEKDPETPRGRPGTGEDIARVISFLCRSDSDFITGNVIDVAGALDPIRSISVLKERNP